jgi:hypothetical protein
MAAIYEKLWIERQAESEKHEEWEVLLHRLVKRGAKAENGRKRHHPRWVWWARTSG